ncbi:hypothetical protein F441_17034 [Phytophthora nicotianae CJ01A1]|uniref:Uncharacterized protein n=4 Tax=Phytophthora nicotianae TaxID=4792 RepID=V9ECB8_PHYNI|nr:hypothetical protein F443_17160 [Phytophthora nicotianae P1569]ETK76991.1 hypothetical protein L915_16701 [Phytophthora nicotianae]ETO65495.1 hypothetical protein F444_17203 [Phytophthora nicotianae P1976]ETP06601.1 hypothetical protein F441_17034 [Phytophthora nicotianae CJ01A1]ETL30420.1 hypothetical protein L916_16609 [Phytophthora nicotianae]
MKRGTPDERRWEHGLRQSTRTSNGPSLMSYPTMNRNSKVTTETKRSSGNAGTPTPLAATTALQTYLANDIDAKSRIPCPVSELVGKTVSRSDASPDQRRLSNASTCNSRRNDITYQENAKPIQLNVRVGVNTENTATADGVAVSRAESPLSRFQKHTRQTHSVPDERHTFSMSTTFPRKGYYHDLQKTPRLLATQSPQSLTRSLMDKINEAKGLWRVSKVRSKDCSEPETLSRGLQSSIEHNRKATLPWPSSPIQERPEDTAQPAAALNNAPPVPHAKPVKPVIPPLPSSASPKNVKSPRESKETATRINDVIAATNAVLSIQHMWRRKRLNHQKHEETDHGPDRKISDHTEVKLIIDKNCADIIPLFRAAKPSSKCSVTKLQSNEVSALHSENEIDLGEDSVVNSNVMSAVPNHPSYYPWTDHELVFLEEGRCIGELQDAVRRGNSVDQDELVWKRPQQVIQKLETRRVSMIQKTRRKREPKSKSRNPLIPSNGATASVLSIVHTVAAPASSMTRGKKMHQRKHKLPRGYRFKLRNTRRKSMLRVKKDSAKSQKLFIREQCTADKYEDYDHGEPRFKASKGEAEPRATPDPPHMDGIVQCSENNEKQADSRLNDLAEIEAKHLNSDQPLALDTDRFVVFSGSELPRSGVGPELSRNDLISVGDLALARSLLYNECRCQFTSDKVEHVNDVIPLTLTTPSIYASVLPGLVSMMDSVIVAETYSTERNGDEHAHGSVTEHAELEDTQGYSSQEPKYVGHPWVWEELLVRMEDSRTRSDDSASDITAPSRGNSNPNESCAIDKAEDSMPQRCPPDSMCALKATKSSVAEMITRVRKEYGDNQQTEAAPSSQHPIPVAQPSRLQLDEEKRIEFLRVLTDFKRCLRSSPSCSSSLLLSDKYGKLT